MATREQLEQEAAELYPREWVGSPTPYPGVKVYDVTDLQNTHIQAKTITAEEVEKAAEAIALEGHNSDCFEEVRRWEQFDEWEREAYSGEYPDMAYEDREDALEEVRAAFRAAGFYVEGEE